MAFIDIGDQFIALSDGRKQPPDDERHFGLVVDDKEAARRALVEAGAEVSPGRGLDFVDPWGTSCPGGGVRRHPVHEEAGVLAGMGLADLRKSEAALAELEGKGCARPALVPQARSAQSNGTVYKELDESLTGPTLCCREKSGRRRWHWCRCR